MPRKKEVNQFSRIAHFTWPVSSTVIETKEDLEWLTCIVNSEERYYNPINEPDLFIRFSNIDLEFAGNAILEFVSEWGLLGLKKPYASYIEKYEKLNSWHDKEEPIILFLDFLKKFKIAYYLTQQLKSGDIENVVQVREYSDSSFTDNLWHAIKQPLAEEAGFLVYTLPVDSPLFSKPVFVSFNLGLSQINGIELLFIKRQKKADYITEYLAMFFSDWFEKGTVIPFVKLIESSIKGNKQLAPRPGLVPCTLADALILQLYNFWLTGQKLKYCKLPGCQEQTVRQVFCSDAHYNLFNQWKWRAAGAIKKNKDLGKFAGMLGKLFSDIGPWTTKEELKALLEDRAKGSKNNKGR